MKILLTHKGWFGLCPVYFGNLDTDAPLIVERCILFLPFMFISEFFMSGMIFILQAIDENYEPMYPLYVTGELKKKLTIEESAK